MAGDEFDIGLTGGVFRSSGTVLDTFEKAVRAVAPRCRIEYVQYPPAIGALFLAFYRSGQLSDELVKRIEASTGDMLAHPDITSVGVAAGAPIINARDPRPEDRREAHRTLWEEGEHRAGQDPTGRFPHSAQAGVLRARCVFRARVLLAAEG